MAVKLKSMVHHIAITKARVNLGQVVRRAHLNNEYFILEKDGIPIAGILGIAELEDYLELQTRIERTDPKGLPRLPPRQGALRTGIPQRAAKAAIKVVSAFHFHVAHLSNPHHLWI